MNKVIRTVKELQQIDNANWDYQGYWNAAEVSLCLGYREVGGLLFQKAIDCLKEGPKESWSRSGKRNKDENIQQCEWYRDYSEKRDLPWGKELLSLNKEKITWEQAWEIRCLGLEVLDDRNCTPIYGHFLLNFKWKLPVD